MTSQVTIRAKVNEKVKDGIGYPESVRVTGCGNFTKDFVDDVAQGAIDRYYGDRAFWFHRYSPDVWVTGLEVSDDMTVPVEYVPAPVRTPGDELLVTAIHESIDRQ